VRSSADELNPLKGRGHSFSEPFILPYEKSRFFEGTKRRVFRVKYSKTYGYFGGEKGYGEFRNEDSSENKRSLRASGLLNQEVESIGGVAFEETSSQEVESHQGWKNLDSGIGGI